MDTETAADTSRGSNALVINRRKINGVLTMTSTINKIGRRSGTKQIVMIPAIAAIAVATRAAAGASNNEVRVP
jgi:hypothetical protein